MVPPAARFTLISMKTKKAAVLSLSLALSLSAFSGCAALGIGAAGGAAGGSVASAKAENRAPERYSAGTYAATILGNAVYFPAKAIFATGGALTSGGAYLVTMGDRDVSRRIWKASVEGDYLLTPRMVNGDERVEFVG